MANFFCLTAHRVRPALLPACWRGPQPNFWGGRQGTPCSLFSSSSSLNETAMAIDAVSRVAHDDAGAREVVGSCGSSVGRTTGCGLRHRVSPSGLFAAAKEMSSTGTGEQQQSNEDGGRPGTDGRRRSANRGSEGGSQAPTAPTSDKVRSAGAPMETASEAALQKLPRAGPEDWRRWAACRAQYSRSPTEGRGSAPGSHIALRREGGLEGRGEIRLRWATGAQGGAAQSTFGQGSSRRLSVAWRRR